MKTYILNYILLQFIRFSLKCHLEQLHWNNSRSWWSIIRNLDISFIVSCFCSSTKILRRLFNIIHLLHRRQLTWLILIHFCFLFRSLILILLINWGFHISFRRCTFLLNSKTLLFIFQMSIVNFNLNIILFQWYTTHWTI